MITPDYIIGYFQKKFAVRKIKGVIIAIFFRGGLGEPKHYPPAPGKNSARGDWKRLLLMLFVLKKKKKKYPFVFYQKNQPMLTAI